MPAQPAEQRLICASCAARARGAALDERDIPAPLRCLHAPPAAVDVHVGHSHALAPYIAVLAHHCDAGEWLVWLEEAVSLQDRVVVLSAIYADLAEPGLVWWRSSGDELGFWYRAYRLDG